MNIFPPKNLKCQSRIIFFTQKISKNVIFNKTKNPRVRFFIYMSSMCVQFFTAFEVMYLGECPNIYSGSHFHENEPRTFIFFLFFIGIIVQ